MTAPPTAHRFIVCRLDRRPVEWQPPEPTQDTGEDVAYWGRAFAAMTELLRSEEPLTFILTWDVRSLPEQGDHVVAVVQGDEDARFPSWANRVRATFKCYGTWPPMVADLHGPPRMIDALELLHFLRRVALWIPGAAARVAWPPRRGPRPPVLPVPLGYYNQGDAAPVPFWERRWSVSFAGSGAEPGAARGIRERIGTPKGRARADMLRALDELRRVLPEEPMTTVMLDDFPSLLPGEDQAARTMTDAYSDLLASTRVCLVPRGNSPETFRYFEALRAGCVVVCESLPRHWFYRDAPVLQLRRWRELPQLLGPLLTQRDRLEALHRASLEWWRERCAEQAVGRFMAEQLNASAGGPAT